MLSELLLTDMHHSPGAAALPLNRRLYESLRRAILHGHLAAGDRLPSSRELTQDLQLSRNTVMAALNQLGAEGYLVSRVGSGTFVNEHLPSPRQRGRAGRTTHAGARLSRR
eukprot:gene50338-61584_t